MSNPGNGDLSDLPGGKSSSSIMRDYQNDNKTANDANENGRRPDDDGC